MPQNQPLTFEEFVERDPIRPMPRYDNFYLYFMTTNLSQEFRKRPFFQRFQEEQPDLEERLTMGIMNRDRSLGISESLRPFDSDLYQAYLIMRGYGASNKELF